MSSDREKRSAQPPPGRRPSPALIVAILALVMATAGTALGGVAAISSLSGKDKKQVKKIADKRIAKKASGLSVAKAVSADTAGSAASAGNAGSADVAKDVSNQFWAAVRSDGSLHHGSPGVSSSPGGTSGTYSVTINRPISGCFFVASLGSHTTDILGAPPPSEIATEGGLSSSDTSVTVDTFDIAGNPAPREFTLLIRC